MTEISMSEVQQDRPVPDRQRTAMRLLVSSAHRSFDPAADLDWAADLDPELPYLPLHRVSLYGTELWQGLSRQQQVELSKHEVASIMQVGLWFELILMQMLLRYAYDLDLRLPHSQYALTEIGDETRHSVMFGRAAREARHAALPAVAPGAQPRPALQGHRRRPGHVRAGAGGRGDPGPAAA